MKTKLDLICSQFTLTAKVVRKVSRRSACEVTFETASPARWGMVEKFGYNEKGEWVKVGMQRAIVEQVDNPALSELRELSGHGGELLTKLQSLFSTVEFKGGCSNLSATFILG